jgi:hypothetical protein
MRESNTSIRVTRVKQDRLLEIKARLEPTRHGNLMSQDDLSTTGTTITTSTILNQLNELGLNCRRSIRRVSLTLHYGRGRLTWCNDCNERPN